MMWGYGWGGPWILFPIIGVIMMGIMMFFMTQMMSHKSAGRGPRPMDDSTELERELRALRREVEHLKREKEDL